MLTVYKYTLPERKDHFSLYLPQGAKILAVQEQYGEGQIWALVNSDGSRETRNFLLVKTGDPIKETEILNFVGTFRLVGDNFIFHLFEIVRKE